MYDIDTHGEIELLTPAIQATIKASEHRGLILPLLLFLAGHRPLAFVVGQLLHLSSPGAAVMGWSAVAQWAELLSHPNGPSRLEERLRKEYLS